MRPARARLLARDITGAVPVRITPRRWGVLLPGGMVVTDTSRVWAPARPTVVSDPVGGQVQPVRGLFIDNSGDGVLYGITDRGTAVRVDGVPWQLIVTGG